MSSPRLFDRRNLSLLLLFLLALAFFLALRWQPETWLRQQLQQAGIQHLSFRSASFSAHGLRLNDVALGEQPLSLHLDGVELAPQWWALLRGVPVLNLRGGARGISISAQLRPQGEAIRIEAIEITAEAAALQAQLAASSWQASGLLHLSGEMALLRTGGQPQSAQLALEWQQAVLTVIDVPLNFGTLSGQLSGPPGSRWEWKLTATGEVALNGRGSLLPQSVTPTQWPLTGTVDLQASGNVASLLQGFGGASQLSLPISGTLASPVIGMAGTP